MGEIANENTPIYKSLTFVFDNVECQKYELEKCMLLKDECEILRKIRIISNEIYSGCEMINEMLVAIYRNKVRGTQLKNGFNKNFIKVYNIYAKQEKEIPEIYRNKFVFSFYMSAKSWYVDIHDIRTQETHYEVGSIESESEELVYVNNNRNGTSKQIYSNASEKINIRINDFIEQVDSFLRIRNVVINKLYDL